MAEPDKTTEYINKAEALKCAEKYSTIRGTILGKHSGVADCIWEDIDDISPADVAPVIHARWHYTGTYPHRVYCPNCNREFLPNMEWIGIYDIPTNYCPCCGAKMDESEDEE